MMEAVYPCDFGRANMTTSLIRPVVALWLALLVLLSSSILLGRQQPIPPPLAIFRLHDCLLPCWIGIIPGETTVQEAQQIITAVYPAADYHVTIDADAAQNLGWITIAHRENGTSLWVNFNEQQYGTAAVEKAVVAQIKLTSPANPLMADWSQVIGEPKALSITTDQHYVAPNVLYFRQQARLTLHASVDSLAVSSPEIAVGALDIYDRLDIFYPVGYFIPWRGWGISYRNELRGLIIP